MLVIKCASQQTYTTTPWKQLINTCYSVCQIGWDCYKHGNRHPKGLKCSSCWSFTVWQQMHTNNFCTQRINICHGVCELG